MKIENIIKLTRQVTRMQMSEDKETRRIFIEGLTVRFAHTKFNDCNTLSVKAYNNDWSVESAELIFDFDMNVPKQIENMIDRIDDLNFYHNRLKRNRKVTNQQA